MSYTQSLSHKLAGLTLGVVAAVALQGGLISEFNSVAEEADVTPTVQAAPQGAVKHIELPAVTITATRA